ncbi:hypothetical protein FRY74_00005, partial [Vicingus serpentipes]
MNKRLTFYQFLTVLTVFFFSIKLSAQTTYYVNDGSLAGDIYTTAVGNNANPGTAAAPFATLTYVVNTIGLSSGDTVFIDAGSFNQTDKNLVFNFNNTHFIGAGSSLTVFNNQAASADANRWATITGSNISVKDLTITQYNFGTSDGTAIYVNGASNLLIQNVLTDENKPGGGGSSIYITNSSSVTLLGGGANCNTAVSLTGGGVKIEGAGNLVSFEDYSFSNNSKDYEGGSGLHIAGTATTVVTVTNSIFADNRNQGAEGGGAIFISGSVLNVTGTCFSDNEGYYTSGPMYGGAIAVARGAQVNLSNCSFTNNTIGSSGKGGAIGVNTSFAGSGSAVIVNIDSCSFSGNTCGEGSDVYGRVGSSNAVTININECTFSGTSLDIRDDNTASINIQNSGNPSATGAGINKLNTTAALSTPNTTCPVLVGSCYPPLCTNPTPTGDATQTFCVADSPIVNNLSAAGGLVVWYDDPTAGSAYTGTEALVDGQTYYASDDAAVCAPSVPRLAVLVNLSDTASPTTSAVNQV